jgi:5-methylcytosine-specific restriction endonuclease McrBC GTP-binding regulatory subunit McrB
MTREEAKNKIAEECGTSVCNNREGGVLLRVNGGVVIPNLVNEIKQLVESNLQVILTGAPGTGKTYTARKVAERLVCEGLNTDAEKNTVKKEHIQQVQFHPGYDYSDFVIGMKPILVSENGKEVFKDEQGRLYTTNNNEPDGQRQDLSGKVRVSYVWKDGVFKEFANRAKKAYDTYPANPQKFVFLIDEINRADLSRVFGELFSLFEEDYRYPTNRKGIILPNGEEFVIPKNLYIIGTMNDIDRSVESMDFALRRRFAWYEVTAEQSERIIEDKIDDAETKRKLLSAMRQINGKIEDRDFRLGKEYQLGGAIFAKYLKYQAEDNPFDSLWNNHIAVILNEYLRGRRDKESKLEELKNVYDNAVGIQPQNGVEGNETASQA